MGQVGRIQVMKPLIRLELGLRAELCQAASLTLEGRVAERAERDVHVPLVSR